MIEVNPAMTIPELKSISASVDVGGFVDGVRIIASGQLFSGKNPAGRIHKPTPISRHG
jgi:hypothetical protein